MHWNAASTFRSSLAEVSKYGMFPFAVHQPFAFFSDTCGERRGGLVARAG